MKKNKLESFRALRSVNQKEILCPIVKLRAVVSPLYVGDDLDLRTMVVSPDIYDEILSQLVYKHTEFIINNDQEKIPKSYDEFINMLSSVDRQVLIWGVVNSTYNTIGEQNIVCTNPKCDHKWKDIIKIDDTIREDSIKIWDKDVPFDEYFHTVDFEIGHGDISKLSFKTGLPSILKTINVIKSLTPSQIKEQMSKFNTLLTKKHQLISMVVEASIYDDNGDLKESVDRIDDIFELFTDIIPNNIGKDLEEKFEEHFSPYSVSFGKRYECSKCCKQFLFEIDPETELFTNFFS
jgi:hypothetical protein